MNLKQAVEYLESIMSDDDEARFDPVIFVKPPDVVYYSDGDDADEREGGVVHDLHFDQLRQPYELRIGPPDEEAEEEEELMDLKATGSSSLLQSTSSSSIKTQARPAAIPASPWKYVGPKIDIKDVLPHIGDTFKWIRKQESFWVAFTHIINKSSVIPFSKDKYTQLCDLHRRDTNKFKPYYKIRTVWAVLQTSRAPWKPERVL